MTSTNEEISMPVKPRDNPLNFQNADLVSRLLAATPPYLYNMPVIPHSFFFSEMLRSLVQAKAAENNQRHQPSVSHRRQRKRSWTQAQTDINKTENNIFQPMWTKNFSEKSKIFDEKSQYFAESEKINLENKGNESKISMIQDFPKNIPSTSSSVPLGFPQISSQSSELPLPAQPSSWYPPFYTNAYGIDPLHFFIDLRVSGHIYDQKNPKDLSSNLQSPSSDKMHFPITPSGGEPYKNDIPFETKSNKETFKQSRHASAFSVPRSVINKNLPVNLSNYSCPSLKNNESKTKFDVKSMGFDKSENKTGTSYIMKNVTEMYKNLLTTNGEKMEVEISESERVDVTDAEKDSASSKILSDDDENLTEEEKEKRVKDLRALIGLELVVDYMKHVKPGQQNIANQDSSFDLGNSDSPTLDVVDIQDEIETVY